MHRPVHRKRHFQPLWRSVFAVPAFFFCTVVSPSTIPLWPTPRFVALTFDDGPHPDATYRLCSVLAHYGVPATFFVVGRVAAEHPEILKFLTLSGHEVENHTWSHPDVRKLSDTALRLELDRTRLLIRETTGRDTFLFRTPGGTETYLRHQFHVPFGYQLVLWDVHSLDQEGHTAQQITARVLANVKDGDVVLMHNGLDSTTEALRTIIPTLKARGFQFVTVSELLRKRSATSSPLFARQPVSMKGEIWTR